MKIALMHGAKKNAGDFLILDRTEKLLKHFYPECEINRFYRNQCLDSMVDDINKNDIMIIAGGPAYNKDFATKLAPMFSELDDIEIPIMSLGLGAHTYSSNDSIIYNHIFKEKTKELFNRAMTDSGLLGCRDYYSMHVLRGNGLGNTIMTGCPAWYDLENVDKVQYTGVPLTDVRKICISDCGIEENVYILFELLRFSREFFGNQREITFVVHRNDYYSENEDFLKMIEAYNIKIAVISDSVNGLAVYDDCDLHIGFRVHAHIYNLSKRKMSILIEEDVRGQGVNDALGLPHITAFDEKNGGINQYAISHITNVLVDLISQNYDKLNEAYRAMNCGFQHMKRHILSIENIVKHWKPREKESALENIQQAGSNVLELWTSKCFELCDTEMPLDDLQILCYELQVQYEKMSDVDKKKVVRMLGTGHESRQIVYLMSVMLRFMKVDGIKDLLLRNILKCDYDWHEGSVVQYQLGSLNLDYVGLRRYRTQIANKYRNALKLNFDYLPVEKRNTNRIVVITDQILSSYHAPTMSVCKYLYTLQELMGYEVILFACPINKIVEPSVWYEPNYAASREDFNDGEMKFSYKNVIFSGYQVTMKGDVLREYHMMHKMIHMWNPMFVLNVSVANPIVELINDYTTLVSQRCSNGIPVSDSDIVMMFEGYIEKDNRGLEYIERSNQHLHMLEQIKPYFERNDVDYTRKQFGLPEDKFIIAVVGNRLDTEVTDEFVDLMAYVADRYPDVIYAVIGNVTYCKNKIDNTSIKDRTYYLGACENLINVYEVLDLYLNPFRDRGGHSSAMALVAGIPVVTLPNCDVASNVGCDFVVNTKEDIVETIGKYINDVNFIEAQKEKIKKYNEDNSKDRGFEMLQRRFEKIISLLK